MAKKQDIQELKVGGGATGASEVPGPVDKKATLPASHLGNGEPAGKVADVTPGQYECDTDEDNNTKPEGNAAASNKASVAAKPSAASSSMKEDMDALFNGEELSEEFKDKATTIFEAAVSARVEALVAEQTAQLQEAQEKAIEDRVLSITEELATNLDDYLGYVVEQWMEDNKVAIEKSLRTEVTEGFIAGLKNLFAENYFDVPEDKIDVAEELVAKVQELEAKLNESIEQNIELKAVVLESQKDKLFADISEGLAATQVEKLRALAEGIEYSDAETYGKKLQIVKESYFAESKKAAVPAASVLTEEVVSVDEEGTVKAVDPSVAKYVSAISRTLKK